MYRISRVSALLEIMEKIENNNYEDANKMITIVSNSIKKDKKNNEYSSYIQLKNRKEALLFHNVIDDTEQD